MEPRVGNKFRLGRKIGSGSFGEIYLGLFYFEFVCFSLLVLNLVGIYGEFDLIDWKKICGLQVLIFRQMRRLQLSL